MSTSDSEEERRRTREEPMITAYRLLHSPCHICEAFLRTILRCLGYESPSFQPENPPAQDTDSEVEMKRSEDAGGGEFSSIAAVGARSRPTRPRISSGRGGQVN